MAAAFAAAAPSAAAPARVVVSGHTQVGDASDDSDAEAEALLRRTDRHLSEGERREMRRIFDSAFRRWFAAALVGNVVVCLLALVRHGVPWGLQCPVKVARWLGALAGSAVSALALFFVGIFVLFPGSEGSGDSSSGDDLSTDLRKDAWLFAWSGVLCQTAVLYVIIHRRHIELVEPGPVHQIWGFHGNFASQILLQYSQLFTPNWQTVPAEVVTYAGRGELEATCTAVNRSYRRVGVAPLFCTVLVLLVVCLSLVLWRRVGAAGRRDFNFVDAAVPLILYVPYLVGHLVFCRVADRHLAEINAQDSMVRRNLGWVLWRTAATNSYSLWLVYRNPGAFALVREGCSTWWRSFAVASPAFRRRVRLFLLVNKRLRRDERRAERRRRRRGEQAAEAAAGSGGGDASSSLVAAAPRAGTPTLSLPSELALLCLSYIVEGDTRTIVDGRPKGFRAVML